MEVEEKVKQLNDRITNNQCPNYLFKKFHENISIPLNSFNLFMQSVWTKIRNNEKNTDFSLDLKDNKLLIMNFMFEKFHNQTYKEILLNYIMKMKKQINQDKQFIELSTVSQEIFMKAESLFEKYSENFYKTEEFYKKKKGLLELIKQDLLDIFKTQTTILMKLGTKNFNESIKTEKLTGYIIKICFF